MQISHSTHRLRLVFAAFLLLSATAITRAQTVINSLPYTISTPGAYVLGSNLTYSNPSGNAITFAVGNVTLDFAGHFISGLGAGSATQAYGLRATDRANITVRNGSIVGFYVGIFLEGNSGAGGNNTGNIIENMRLPSNTVAGVSLVYPTTCRVEGCQVNKTGGSTVSSNADTYGIVVVGGSMTIRNNQVSTLTGVGTGSGYGIFCYLSNAHFIIGNQVDTCAHGVDITGSSKYQDNLTANCTTPFSGGTDAGGNN